MDTSSPLTPSDLAAIINVAHATSAQGGGKPLIAAISEARYRELRPQVTAAALLPFMTRSVIQQWVQYSADKRTDCGWYLLEDGKIGTVGGRKGPRYDSMPRAVAEYILRELDEVT